MDVSLAFVASALNKNHTVALRDADGLFIQFEHILELSNLPTFKTARLCKSAPNDAYPFPAEKVLFVVEEKDRDYIDLCGMQNGIVYIGNYEPPRGINAIWLTSPASGIEVLEELLDLFKGLNAWSVKLHKALLKFDAIPEVVSLLSEVTDNPFWFADEAMRVRFMSEDRGLSEYSEKWRYQQESGRYSASTIETLVSSGDLDLLGRNTKAWVFNELGKTYTLPFVTKAVFVNGSIAGYLFCIQLHMESCTRDLELCEYLGNIIATFLRHGRMNEHRNRRVCTQLLRGCLAGNEVSDEDVSHVLALLSWQRSPGYIVAAFDRCARDAARREAPQVQVELLSECLGFGHAFAYDRLVVVVASTDGTTHKALEQECGIAAETLGWHVGVSDEFSSLSIASIFYGQAQIALKKGMVVHPESRLHLFRECHMAYVAQKVCLMMSEPMYFHPDVIKLLDHDQANRSNLVETLRVHLMNERSITKTAKDLNLHRNSVIYRMGIIESILDSDLEDSKNRLDLLLSLRILQSADSSALSMEM